MDKSIETNPMNTNNNNNNNNDLSDDGNDDDDDDDECFPWQDTQPVLPPNNSLTTLTSTHTTYVTHKTNPTDNDGDDDDDDDDDMPKQTEMGRLISHQSQLNMIQQDPDAVLHWVRDIMNATGNHLYGTRSYNYHQQVTQQQASTQQNHPNKYMTMKHTHKALNNDHTDPPPY